MKNQYIKPVTRLLNLRLPPSGFILQKDVYTTNLLYANDQLSPEKKNSWFSFRSIPTHLPNNPGRSLRIFNETECSFSNFNMSSSKSKKMIKTKLKFPLPKIVMPPISLNNYNKNLCKRDLNILFIEDDLNIASNKGKKIFYNYKKNKLSPDKCTTEGNINNIKNENNSEMNVHLSPSKSVSNCKRELKVFGEIQRMKLCKNRGKCPSTEFLYAPYMNRRIKNIRNTINLINYNMKIMKKQEIEHRKMLSRDDMFATQIRTYKASKNRKLIKI